MGHCFLLQPGCPFCDVEMIIDNLSNIHNCYTGTIGQVSYKQPKTTCEQLLKNVQNNIQDNVQYNSFLINIPLL
jgi:hypothetical protein